jgi:uncharacterized protein
MTGAIAALFRHPIKGFTPERVEAADLAPGAMFPGDRLFAVENGPSGFDPAAPAWISKMKFAVLAAMPAVARVRTDYDEARGVLRAGAPGARDLEVSLTNAAGRAALEAWLTTVLAAEGGGPYRLVAAPGHRFTDHPRGEVSIINLESVRDLARRLGVEVDPLRFRANLYVEGWPAWAELEWQGRELGLGEARARVFEPIVRCAATMVDPATGERDLDVPGELHRLYGHLLCGIYVHVERAGTIRPGDPAGPLQA